MLDLLNDQICQSMPDRSAGRLPGFAYEEDVPGMEGASGIPFPAVAGLIWQIREHDLQKLFSLGSPESRDDFLAWCILNGRKEYHGLRELSDWWHRLQQPPQVAPDWDDDDAAHLVTPLLRLIKRGRPDLGFDLNTRQGRAGLVIWYLVNGRAEVGLDDIELPSWYGDWLAACAAQSGLNRLQALLYAARPDLRECFALPQQIEAYLQWCHEFFEQHPRVLARLRPTLAVKPPSDLGLTWRQRPFGVNLIGDVHSPKGIAEDLRMAARALTAAGVPLAIRHFGSRATTPPDADLEAPLAAEPHFAINLFCMTAFEQARCALDWGIRWTSSHYNIGFWPWELDRWPEEWRHILCLVDEVWSSSVHTATAFRKTGLRPVRQLPMAVAIPTRSLPRRASLRKQFNLPLSGLLFLFIFDLDSSSHRKNPHACIDAFLRAFPLEQHGGSGPELVIKILPPKQDDPEWNALRAQATRDPRIHLISAVLSRQQLQDLYRCVDCFVSLHRAEGFGRCLAEALLLQTPLICTAYSGNADFTHVGNAWPVNYRLQVLRNGDYPHGTGMEWAEPDVEHAAQCMREVALDVSAARRRAKRGSRELAARHAPGVVGRIYREVLMSLTE